MTAHPLPEAGASLRGLLECAPDAMVIADEHGTIALVNAQAERLFGYTREELVGQPIELLVPERLHAAHTEHRASYLARPRVRPMGAGLDLSARHRDGHEFPVEISLGPLEGDDGRLICAAIRDVSESRRRAREQHELELKLRETQRLESLGVLAGGIAHDFNNLLSVILGNASMVLPELEDPSQCAAVAQIELAARRAAGLTRQLLAYAGKGRFVVEPARLSQIVEEMAELLESTTSAKATLRLTLDPDTPAIDADVNQMRQIVLNLLANASEALDGRSGTIRLATGRVVADRSYLATYELAEDLPEGEYVFLEVTDTGAGMDEATRARIFDPFFTTKFTGRGLGLAAVLGIVRGHRGAIRVYSEPGHGTAFKLLLPVSSADAADASTAGGAEEWRGSGVALVVDDEPSLRVLAGQMLERLGFDVRYAADGAQGLEKLNAGDGDFAFVLLDLTMPTTDGEEVLAELERRGTTIPVILCSGYNAQDLSRRLVGKGVAAFIQKPYRLSELSATVQQVLDQG